MKFPTKASRLTGLDIDTDSGEIGPYGLTFQDVSSKISTKSDKSGLQFFVWISRIQIVFFSSRSHPSEAFTAISSNFMAGVEGALENDEPSVRRIFQAGQCFGALCSTGGLLMCNDV